MQTPSPRSIAQGIHLCLANAERFVTSAQLLLQNDRPQDSYLLTLYSLEEMGKIVLICNALFYTDTPEKWRRWQKRFKDHEEKFWFSKDLDDFSQGQLADPSNRTEAQRARGKERVAYVEFGGNKFIGPETITRDAARSLLDRASKRLAFLKNNHPSVETDEASIIESLSLKGLNEQQLRAIAESKRQVEPGELPKFE